MIMHSDDANSTIINNKEQPKKDTPSALSARIQNMVSKLGFFGAGLFCSYFLLNPQTNTSKTVKDHETESPQNQNIIRFLEREIREREVIINRSSEIIQQHRYRYNKITSELQTERKAKEDALKRVNELQNELDECKQISAKKQRYSL